MRGKNELSLNIYLMIAKWIIKRKGMLTPADLKISRVL